MNQLLIDSPIGALTFGDIRTAGDCPTPVLEPAAGQLVGYTGGLWIKKALLAVEGIPCRE